MHAHPRSVFVWHFLIDIDAKLMPYFYASDISLRARELTHKQGHFAREQGWKSMELNPY